MWNVPEHHYAMLSLKYSSRRHLISEMWLNWHPLSKTYRINPKPICWGFIHIAEGCFTFGNNYNINSKTRIAISLEAIQFRIHKATLGVSSSINSHHWGANSNNFSGCCLSIFVLLGSCIEPQPLLATLELQGPFTVTTVDRKQSLHWASPFLPKSQKSDPWTRGTNTDRSLKGSNSEVATWEKAVSNARKRVSLQKS